jgi:hypothetical protein
LRFGLISGGKLRTGNEYRVRPHTRGSRIGGNSGTWLQPLGPDALNSGELRDSCCRLVLLSLHDDWNNRLLELYKLAFPFHRP